MSEFFCEKDDSLHHEKKKIVIEEAARDVQISCNKARILKWET
jgi:hypothetical protein